MNAGRLVITSDDRLRQICSHWKQRVQTDPNVKVPAWFAALLDAAALAISDNDSAYANNAIKVDQLAAYQGTPDGDRSVFGTSLKAAP